jgi:hypothetical protein
LRRISCETSVNERDPVALERLTVVNSHQGVEVLCVVIDVSTLVQQPEEEQAFVALEYVVGRKDGRDVSTAPTHETAPAAKDPDELRFDFSKGDE